jgi:hypothetical protein
MGAGHGPLVPALGHPALTGQRLTPGYGGAHPTGGRRVILARLPVRPLAVIEKPSHLRSEAFEKVVVNPPSGPALDRRL